MNKLFLSKVTLGLALTAITFFAAIKPAYSTASSLPSEPNESLWRQLDPKKTVLLTLPHGKVVIELAPQFSPNHVKQFSQLVQQGFYDGTAFYRVIDGFVAQAGPKDGSVKDKAVTTLAIEGEWSIDKNWSFTPVQQSDLFAEQTGFKAGFALATHQNEQGGQAWLTHCPGTLAMARSNDPDSASSHFYFVIGQAPRYLDRIMTIFGRVVYGMQHIQAIQRTSVIEGEKPISAAQHTVITQMQLMADVPAQEQLIIEVENTDNKAFAKRIAQRRARDNAFFYKKPPPVLDVCQTPVRSRLIK
ncbi:peptidylprolyl isomerase [Colwellia sp. D2M02]|uniref:peptidylprolyl isomerase n=1 Tax=Colwellia sp. D2M02 TaxID=2841562 RepID=UPI001C0A1D78|nr:peptidylprolyl isomerase [Colwellia sp. D2M02]MBU2894653.1 peptidylprolyl isomerase [Colwellia sp. D2M02]